MFYREALTVASIKILSDQNKELRYYFKLIKDYGGFKPFDLSGRNKVFRIVDMDEEEKKDKDAAFDMMMASTGDSNTTSSAAAAVVVATETIVEENAVVDNKESSSNSVTLTVDSKEIVVDDDDNNNNGMNALSGEDLVDEDFSLFSQGVPSTGPMMM